MKKHTRALTILLLILCIIMHTVPITATTNGISVYLNNNPIWFDVPPQIINGRTMVPMRAIFEAMGATVTWDDSTKSVYASKNYTDVKLSVGYLEMYKNGAMIYLDSAPQIVSGRVLVPARAIAEAFGCSVTWDSSTSTVYITGDMTTTVSSYLNYYPGTDVPTYTSIMGIPLKELVQNANGSIYVYNYTDSEDIKTYWNTLSTYGWQLYDTELDYSNYSYTLYLTKGYDLIGIQVQLTYNEVWIIAD